jgi:hypothetical protein
MPRLSGKFAERFLESQGSGQEAWGACREMLIVLDTLGAHFPRHLYDDERSARKTASQKEMRRAAGQRTLVVEHQVFAFNFL